MTSIDSRGSTDVVLNLFKPAVREWFNAAFAGPTRPQILGWPPISRGDSTLILVPTGSGKTLAAFLWCINRLMFAPQTAELQRCRVVYISPIKALAVDVERNLRAPLVGVAQATQRLGIAYNEATVAICTGDTPPAERARFLRHPSDILITTPESLYLLLTSVEAVIVDEIHAVVPTKRGSRLALSIERLEHLAGRRLQRIGLSATQRPLEEVGANVSDTSGDKIVTYCGLRRTTGRTDNENDLWVYGRRGKPGRRCGTPIESRKQGLDARTAFWCSNCQPFQSSAARHAS